MIIFDLSCQAGGHRFEGWFGSSDDFARQQERGLLNCPQCGSSDVAKAPMAPNLARKGNQIAQLPAASPPASPSSLPAPTMQEAAQQPMATGAMPPEALKMMQALHALQTAALSKSRWVGDSFAEDARAMHYGEREVEAIHGEATAAEAKELWEEGIEVAPLPFPVAKPGEAN